MVDSIKSLVREGLSLNLQSFIFFIIAFMVLYANVNFLNEYSVFGLKPGSLGLIILALLTVWSLMKIIKFLHETKFEFLIYLLPLLLIVPVMYLDFNVMNPIFVGEESQVLIGTTSEINDFTKDIEFRIFEYTNLERHKAGNKLLHYDNELADVARQHSLDMVKRDFFSHTNPDFEEPTDRAKKFGYNTRKLKDGKIFEGIGENIGKVPVGDVLYLGKVENTTTSIAKNHVDNFMQSESHKENILNEDYDYIGVGVVFDGKYYVVTQNFK